MGKKFVGNGSMTKIIDVSSSTGQADNREFIKLLPVMTNRYRIVIISMSSGEIDPQSANRASTTGQLSRQDHPHQVREELAVEIVAVGRYQLDGQPSEDRQYPDEQHRIVVVTGTAPAAARQQHHKTVAEDDQRRQQGIDCADSPELGRANRQRHELHPADAEYPFHRQIDRRTIVGAQSARELEDFHE